MAKTTHQNAEAAKTIGQSAAFGLAVGFVLRKEIEGGYVNDPRDPGGETNFGISKRAYPNVNIAELTRDEAIEIYHRDYWLAAHCDKLPNLIAVCVFDAAVNQGVGAATRLLQKAARVAVDGQIGPKTLRAVHQADTHDLMVEYLGWRLHRYANTNNAFVYMRGWSNRILRLTAFALANFGEMDMGASNTGAANTGAAKPEGAA